MADTIDQRIVRVGIEVDGEIKVYEGLDIRARGQKTANSLQNNCDVTITNLSKQTRDYILTETSPFNANKTPKTLILEAGRVSTGVSRLFVGNITSAQPTQPPDIGLQLKAQTGSFAKGTVVARSGAAKQQLKSIASRIAAELGVAFDFQAQDKQIANYAFNGSLLQQIDSLSFMGEIDAFLDDDTLVIKNRGAGLAGRVRILSQESGLIGIPETTERGVKVTMLLDNTTVLGGSIDLTSKLNPSLNGMYTIYGLDFEVATRSEPFYFTAACRRPDFKAAPHVKIKKLKF